MTTMSPAAVKAEFGVRKSAPGGSSDVSASTAFVVETRELRKVFGSGAAEQVVLKSIDLKVSEGEMIAVVGPSGSGKSTLLHLLAALDMPTSGAVYFRSRELKTLPESHLEDFRNQAVGFVWQRHHLLPDFSAAENVAMPLLMRGARQGAALDAEGFGRDRSRGFRKSPANRRRAFRGGAAAGRHRTGAGQ